MRKWEDIVRERLKGYESALPDGSLADFRARRTASAGGSAGHIPSKRSALPWALAAAVAAGLAAVIFLRHPAEPGDGAQPLRQPSTPVAVVADTAKISEPLQPEPIQEHPYIAHAVTPKAFSQPSVTQQEIFSADTISKYEASVQESNDVSIQDPSEQQSVDTPVTTDASPYIPETAGTEPVKMHFEPSAGLLAGGGLVATLVATVIKANKMLFKGIASGGQLSFGTNPPIYIPIESYESTFPLRMGLSVGIPVTEKLRLTNGLEYSCFQSTYTDYVNGERRQLAHYLGVPIRLDRILARDRWFDLYIGGGIQGDFCLGATLDGERIQKDDFSLSLLGVTGAQFNFNRYIGLYLESEVSWTIPSEGQILQTYRSDHPFMFSITTGFRITIDK